MLRIKNSRLAPFAALAASCFVSCGPKPMQELLQPGEALAKVLSEETARTAGAKKRIALITHDPTWGTLSTVEESFRAAMKKQGFTLDTVKAANLGDPMSATQIGLKGSDFAEALEKSNGAGAVVSFVGGPRLLAEDIARVPQEHPPVLVVATARLGTQIGVPTEPARLAALLDAKVIQMAIIDGADPSAPGGTKSDAMHQLFAQNYRLLRRVN
jgi:hypothetical protein